MTTKEELCNELHKIINTELETNMTEELKTELIYCYNWNISYFSICNLLIRINPQLASNEYLKEIIECFEKVDGFHDTLKKYFKRLLNE